MNNRPFWPKNKRARRCLIVAICGIGATAVGASVVLFPGVEEGGVASTVGGAILLIAMATTFLAIIVGVAIVFADTVQRNKTTGGDSDNPSNDE